MSKRTHHKLFKGGIDVNYVEHNFSSIEVSKIMEAYLIQAEEK